MTQFERLFTSREKLVKTVLDLWEKAGKSQAWQDEVTELLGLDEELDENIDTYREIVAFLDSVEDTTLNSILQNFIRNTDGDITKEVVMTESDYETLQTKDAHTIYNIVED